jgi:hypothetical protein
MFGCLLDVVLSCFHDCFTYKVVVAGFVLASHSFCWQAFVSTLGLCTVPQVNSQRPKFTAIVYSVTSRDITRFVQSPGYHSH